MSLRFLALGGLYATATICKVMGAVTAISSLSGRESKMTSDQTFIRVKEAAAMLGVSTNTLRAWGAAGKIPQYRHPVNNYRLYKREEIEQLLKKLREPENRQARR